MPSPLNNHLYSTSAGGKDLFNDTQIRVISSMEPEICPKMLRNLSKKLAAKFSGTTRSYSVVKEGQSLQQKDK